VKRVERYTKEEVNHSRRIRERKKSIGYSGGYEAESHAARVARLALLGPNFKNLIPNNQGRLGF